MFFHKLGIMEGLMPSVSAIEEMPGMEKAVTPYRVANGESEKEAVFEQTRARHYASRPSRLKAWFVFDSLDAAEQAQHEWFRDGARVILEARVTLGSVLHRGDARWLDTPKAEWEASAKSYWAGVLTAEPRPEVVVHGALYFPAWRTHARTWARGA